MSILKLMLLRQADGTVRGLHLNRAVGSLLKSKSGREAAATIHAGYTTPQRTLILQTQAHCCPAVHTPRLSVANAVAHTWKGP